VGKVRRIISTKQKKQFNLLPYHLGNILLFITLIRRKEYFRKETAKF
jgi:hypothetical protein